LALFTGISACDAGSGEGEGDVGSESEESGPETPLYSATIQWTEGGVPHITGDRLEDVMFGQGYAFASLNGCVLADQIVKVRSERALYFGAGEYAENVESDALYLHLGVYANAQRGFATQDAEVQAAVRAYAMGYNEFLAQRGNELRCAGTEDGEGVPPWLQPISEIDLFAYYTDLALVTSGQGLAPFILAAQPPVTGFAPAEPESSFSALRSHRPGSNGWALGADLTANGKGLLVANPHFPWEGELKLFEAHLQVPGSLNVYGASLLGVAGVLIGFNEDVAWTHTVATGQRFTFYQLELVPGDPFSYVYDGETRAIEAQTYEIEVLSEDETVTTVERTLYRTHFGPMVALPSLGWSDVTAFAVRDANDDNTAVIAQYLGMNLASSLEEFKDTHAEVSGVPWVNTIAVSREGVAWYADASAMPNVSPTALAAWQERLQTDFVTAAVAANGFVLLPGNTSAFEWTEDPSARKPGLIPFAQAPSLERRDFVFNANGSPWFANPREPIVGYSPLYGAQAGPRGPRDRTTAAILLGEDASWSGEDGRFDLAEVQAAILDNTGIVATLLRDEVVARCEAQSSVTVEGEEIDLGPSCSALAAWDGSVDLDSEGALVWREFLGSFTFQDTVDAGVLFAEPFVASDREDGLDAVTFPRGLVPPTDDPNADPVLLALAAASGRLAAAGLEPSTTIREAQFVNAYGLQLPVHGGLDREGVLNLVGYYDLNSTLTPNAPRGALLNPETGLTTDGYPTNGGSSFSMTVSFTTDGPKAEAILFYGQSSDPASPHFWDQASSFVDKVWRPVRFEAESIAESPELVVEQVELPPS